jgi:hypothetical protein
MRRYLYINTHRFVGMPAVDNAWLYPDILRWGQDTDGNFFIPDFVIIYYDQSYAYPYEKRWALTRQLSDLIPPRWDCYWFLGQGYIYAERRDFDEPSIFSENIRNMNRHAAHQYDTSLASTNGHFKEVLEDGNVMLVVPQHE